MTDRPDADREPETFADLPIQPTGSGVADLEIAYEQMRLAEDDTAAAPGPAVTIDDAAIPTDRNRDEAESEAHPS